ncbi:MAG: hypothetical protein Q9217_003677 [Psora testacea]
MAPTIHHGVAFLLSAISCYARGSIQYDGPTVTPMPLAARADLPTITISTPAAWVDTSASIPSDLGTETVIITSASLDSNPQIYLGASIAASARAAVEKNCPKAIAADCIPSIQEAVNHRNALTIQARVGPLILVYPALMALVSVVIEYILIKNSEARLQLLEIKSDVLTKVASAQPSSTVVFVTGSNDPNPITVPLTTSDDGRDAQKPTSKGGGSITPTASVTLSTPKTGSSVYIVVPTEEAAPIASILKISSAPSACAPTSSAPAAQKRGLSFDWQGSVAAANEMWSQVAPGGDLESLNTAAKLDMPPFQVAVQLAILEIVKTGEQVINLALDNAGKSAIAIVLFFIALSYKYCLQLDPHTFVIPAEALLSSGATPSASGTTRSCPPPIQAPDCGNCGGEAGSSKCLGIKTKDSLWAGCDCYNPQRFGYAPFGEQQLLEIAAEWRSMIGPPASSTPSKTSETSSTPSKTKATSCNCNENGCTEDSPECCVGGTCTIENGKPITAATVCLPFRIKYKPCYVDIDGTKFDATVWNLINKQMPNENLTEKSPNVTQFYAAGRGVTYIANVGWIPGCTLFQSQDPKSPSGDAKDERSTSNVLFSSRKYSKTRKFEIEPVSPQWPSSKTQSRCDILRLRHPLPTSPQTGQSQVYKILLRISNLLLYLREWSHDDLIAYILRLQKALQTPPPTPAVTTPQVSPAEVSKKVDHLRQLMVRQIKKAMTWKPSCTTGRATFSQDFIVQLPLVVRELFSSVVKDGKDWKMKRFSVDEFEEVVDHHIQASVRYSYLTLSGDVTVRPLNKWLLWLRSENN